MNLPKNYSVLLEVTEAAYRRWFENGAMAKMDYPSLKLQLAVETTYASPLLMLRAWLCFDLDNGDPGKARYVWVFRTRAEARAHRRQQHLNVHNARLSQPQQWSLQGEST